MALTIHGSKNVKGRPKKHKPLVTVVDRKVEEFNAEQDRLAKDAMLAALKRRGMKLIG